MNVADLELIHQDSVSSLYFVPDLPGTYLVWHGFASSADFRATCLRSLELIRERRTYKSISDARNLRIISLADQQWATEEFLPMISNLQVHPRFYSGTIVPQDYFGRQSLATLTERAYAEIEANYHELSSVKRYFESVDAAHEWLLTVDAENSTTEAAPASAARANETASAAAA